MFIIIKFRKKRINNKLFQKTLYIYPQIKIDININYITSVTPG